MKRIMVHQVTRQYKEVKSGFSWTTLFFGPLVPLFRGDLFWFCLMLLLSGLTCGVSLLIFPFCYNNLYAQKLMNRGYKFI